ncbi:hypothetical protein M0R45_030594 [Rubus argutus]|uniref:Uncharacterized protein n=1 Tax=Rubus argutus TaxID=59490 RepID=A0AAW1WDN4_RUBAR
MASSHRALYHRNHHQYLQCNQDTTNSKIHCQTQDRQSQLHAAVAIPMRSSMGAETRKKKNWRARDREEEAAVEPSSAVLLSRRRRRKDQNPRRRHSRLQLPSPVEP